MNNEENKKTEKGQIKENGQKNGQLDKIQGMNK